MRALPRILAAAATGVAGLGFTSAALAQTDFSVGGKVLAGATVWTTPSDVPENYEGLGFAGSAGGFSWGGGAYFEARFIKVIGFELDLFYDHSTMYRDVTIDDVVEVREKVTMTSLRLPLLVKGTVPMPVGRLFALLGPELVFARSADPSIEFTRNENLVTNAEEVKQAIHAEEKNSTLLTMGLGFALDLPGSLELPFELRASKSLSQESAWDERVELQPSPFSYTVQAQPSWDFRLVAGLGYQF